MNIRFTTTQTLTFAMNDCCQKDRIEDMPLQSVNIVLDTLGLFCKRSSYPNGHPAETKRLLHAVTRLYHLGLDYRERIEGILFAHMPMLLPHLPKDLEIDYWGTRVQFSSLQILRLGMWQGMLTVPMVECNALQHNWRVCHAQDPVQYHFKCLGSTQRVLEYILNLGAEPNPVEIFRDLMALQDQDVERLRRILWTVIDDVCIGSVVCSFGLVLDFSKSEVGLSLEWERLRDRCIEVLVRHPEMVREVRRAGGEMLIAAAKAQGLNEAFLALKFKYYSAKQLFDVLETGNAEAVSEASEELVRGAVGRMFVWKLPDWLDNDDTESVALWVRAVATGRLTNFEDLRIQDFPDRLLRIMLMQIQPYVTLLSLSGGQFQSTDFLHMLQFPRLERLDLSGCPRLERFGSTCSMPALKRLDLSNNAKLTNLTGLVQTPAVTHLNLRNTPDHYSEALLDSLANLEWVDVRGCDADFVYSLREDMKTRGVVMWQ